MMNDKIPVFHYVHFGLGPEYWRQGLYDTIHIYKMAKKILAEYR